MKGYERKLTVGLALIMLAFLPSLGFSLYFLSSVIRSQNDLNTHHTRALVLAQELRTLKAQQGAMVPIFVLGGDEGALRHLDRSDGEFERALSSLLALPLAPENAESLRKVGEMQRRLAAVEREGIAMRRAGIGPEAVNAHFRDRAAPLVQPILDDLDRLVDGMSDAYEAKRSRNDDVFARAFRVLLAASAASVFFCGAAGVLLVRLIRQKRDYDGVRERLAERDRAVAAARKEAVETVAHDLRNPLAAVSMAADYLRGRADLPPGKATRMAEAISSAATSMELLIRNLLDHAKIEAGGLALDVAPSDLGPVLARLAQRHELLGAERGIEVVCDVPASLPAVPADAVRIEQVLANLLGNALKFTPRGGSVGIAHSLAGGWLLVSVTDTGPGLAPDQAGRVFERFWQGGPQASQGAGLGLAISRSIALAHGGDLDVESQPGRGARFTLRIPAPGAAPVMLDLAA